MREIIITIISHLGPVSSFDNNIIMNCSANSISLLFRISISYCFLKKKIFAQNLSRTSYKPESFDGDDS
jgi:hypothetical protein